MKNRKVYCFIIACSIFLLNCSKGKKDTPVPPVNDDAPKVLSASPAKGGFETQVIITGTNFSRDTALDIVKINGKQASIIRAKTDTLIISVPLGAVGADPVSVTVSNKTALGPAFTYVPGLVVFTLAGNGVSEFPINGASDIATINAPVGIAVDDNGTVYVAEYNRIKKISAGGGLSVFSGSGIFGYADSTSAYAQFKYPTGLAVDLSGNIIVADRGNNCIRKITTGGDVTTIAGSPAVGYADGYGASARFSNPTGVVVDLQGNIYVADEGNYRIRKITPAGYVSTFAGNGVRSYADGPGDQAEFNDIYCLSIDNNGNLYAYETGDDRIRMISPSGAVSTFFGSTTNFHGADANLGMTVDANGNVFIGDGSWGSISEISPSDFKYYAGNGTMGYQDGEANTARFNQPAALAADKQGNIYVCDLGNSRIREISTR